jgi:hypothetical protein
MWRNPSKSLIELAVQCFTSAILISLIDRKRSKVASYSEPGSNKINIYLPKFNANDSDNLTYGFGRVKLDDIK